MRHLIHLATILGLAGPAASPAVAQQSTPPTAGEAAALADGQVGTLIIAHGAGPDWNAQVETVAAAVSTGGPVEVAYLMGPAAADHRFQDRVARLVQAGAGEVVVVPLLMSSHSGHYDQIRYLVGELDSLPEVMAHHLNRAGIARANVDVPIRLTRAIDASPQIVPVLVDRALALADAPADQAVFLIGHGPNGADDYAGWMANLRPIADSVKVAGGFRDVKLGLVRDDAPDAVRAEAVRRIREIIELQHELTGQPVVVVPILISQGRITREKLPRDLADLPIAYSGEALLPHPGLARWIEARVRAAASLATTAPSAHER